MRRWLDKPKNPKPLIGEENIPNPILVTGAAGRVGAVGRTVTELLLKQGKAVRAIVRNQDERAQALRVAGAEVVVGDLLEPADVYRVVSGFGGSTSACPFLPGTWRRL